MQLKSILTCASVLAVGLASQAPAATGTWTGGTDSDWSESSNWENGRIPGAGDVAVIPDTSATFHPIISTTYAASINIAQLQVASGGQVDIGPGGTLTLDDASDVTHTIDGFVYLTSSTSVMRFDDVNHVLSGSGDVIGQHNDAKIQIENGLTLRLASGTDIKGSLQIEPVSGNPTFEVDGMVISDAAGILLLDDNVSLSTNSTGSFKVFGDAGCAAKMQFLEAATGLASASFVLDGGTFDFDVSVTVGSLTFDEGILDVFTDMTFTYNSYASTGSACPNPGGGGSGPWSLTAGAYDCGDCPEL